MKRAEIQFSNSPSTTSAQPGIDRSFEARYGKPIVDRGIATIPTVLLRYQGPLGLKDGHVVLISTVLSFYSSPPSWPSVSVEKMAKWRGLSPRRIEKEIRELEALGYLIRPGRDPKHGRSYFFDLTPLLKRLTYLAQAEGESERIRKAGTSVMKGALFALSTDRETNRELKQRTKKETDQKRSLKEDANTSHVQKLAVENRTSSPIEKGPVGSLPKRDLHSADSIGSFELTGDDRDRPRPEGGHVKGSQ